jgi:hypothetical protein
MTRAILTNDQLRFSSTRAPRVKCPVETCEHVPGDEAKERPQIPQTGSCSTRAERGPAVAAPANRWPSPSLVSGLVAAEEIVEQAGTGPDRLRPLLHASSLSDQGHEPGPHSKLNERPTRGFLVWLAQESANLHAFCDGRTPFELFTQRRFLGNARIAPCSQLLKQKPCRRWLSEHTDPADTILYVGLEPGEQRRAPAITVGWRPWRVEYPLMRHPSLTKDDLLAWCRDVGLKPPRLYRLGFGHNNCGGLCVRGGQAPGAAPARSSLTGSPGTPSSNRATATLTAT